MNQMSADKSKPIRLLLVEANNMGKWVGGDMPFAVHIPPIGLMYLAAFQRRTYPGLEVRIIESSLHCPTDKDYIAIIREFDPTIVGIRSITFFLEELQRIAALTRAHSDALILAGGPIVHAYREMLLAEVPELDLAVKGEGEQTLARIISGVRPEDIQGIFYRRAGLVVENADAPMIADIEDIPFPAYDLIDLDLYQRQLSYAYNHRRQGILLTGRGCVYHCTFCFNQWEGLRLRSAENVYAEIRALYETFHIRDFYFVDDIFNVNLKRAFALFDLIRSDGLEIRIYFANGLRTDLVTEEFVDQAVAAGAIWFTYAIESACEGIQNLVRKKIDLSHARSIIGYTQRKGVVVNISTMFGFPTETRAQAQETLDWLGTLEMPSLLPYHFCLRCFPGCEITEQALQAGWDPLRMDLGSRMSYNDLPLGTPTLLKSDMNKILLEYHRRFGLANAGAVDSAVRTLRSVGYSDEEIVHMYSVLKRKRIGAVDELLVSAAQS
jgi:anaerobic magnesium-protoporphyrin IX monomethyl ester cyclase